MHWMGRARWGTEIVQIKSSESVTSQYRLTLKPSFLPLYVLTESEASVINKKGN